MREEGEKRLGAAASDGSPWDGKSGSCGIRVVLDLDTETVSFG